MSRHSSLKIAALAGAVAVSLLATGACQGPGVPQQEATNPPPPPPPPPSPVETFAVTGAKAPHQDVQTVPIAIAVFNSDKRSAAGINSIQGLAYGQPSNTSQFSHEKPNAVKVTADEPVSTFSIDVDTASYGVVRDALNNGALPQADAVRVEEMVNYFDYAYPLPQDRKTPFSTSVRVYPTPWNADTKLLHIGIKGFDIPHKERPSANLVFLIDTSGSMQEPNKLPLLKRSFRLLVDQLGPNDKVTMVTYAGSAGVALEPTSGADKTKIMAALDKLEAGGSTAGGEGIRLAYSLAEANFVKGGVNRVLLATDGDFNVGITDPNALESFVKHERETGVYLTCLGFGNDNYNDAMMQKIAQAGNGNAAFIDTLNEAQKVFVDQISGTLFTIANDVKIQVEFNPQRVAEYRLIGYETRLLNRTDFNNDKVDAGDIGSGTTVTALYEVTPVGSKAAMADPLRYKKAAKSDGGSEYAFLKVRYKLPGEKESKLITRPVTDTDAAKDFASLPADVRFATSVAGAAQLMRSDPYIKTFSYDRAIDIANGAKGEDKFGYRAEFVQLLRLAKALPAQKPLEPPPGSGE